MKKLYYYVLDYINEYKVLVLLQYHDVRMEIHIFELWLPSIKLIYLVGDGGEEYVRGMFCVFVFVLSLVLISKGGRFCIYVSCL